MSNIKRGQTLRINELYFKADSTEISLESNTVLEEIYAFLNANPSVDLKLEDIPIPYHHMIIAIS